MIKHLQLLPQRYFTALADSPANPLLSRRGALSEAISQTTNQEQPPKVASPRGHKTRIVTFRKLQDILPKIVCLALLALHAGNGLAQEADKRDEKPKQEKKQPGLLDRVLDQAGKVTVKTKEDEVPRDFEANAKRDYEQIADPEVSFKQYLEASKQEYSRLARLKKSPQFAYVPTKGQQTPCGNGDFEAGLSATQWQGAYGTVPWSGDPNFPAFTDGILSGALNLNTSRQTPVGPGGYDPTIGGTLLPLTAPGSTRAVRIGNSASGGGSELLSKTFTVTAAESLISFWYAAVFQDPGHPLSRQPSFWVRITNTSTGVEIPNLVDLGNGTSKLVADGANPFFQKKPGNNAILYKNWTCAQINLSQQIGKTVTIEFVTEDCAEGGHYGYAYLDNFCGSCLGSPTGSVSFAAQGSSACGPGTICFDYTLPKNPTTGATGSASISLGLYQGGALLTTLTSPTLTSGTSYCFNITPSAIPGINAGLGGFDFVATGVFTLAGAPASTMSVGTAPAGRVAGTNNDYQIACSTPVASKWCCPGTNLLANGDFEAGNTAFSSQYAFGAAALPGKYNVITGAQALAVSPQWAVADHSTCNANSGKFMVVNGRTTQTMGTIRSIWKQTVNVVAGKEYRFCANVKNMPQCTFDVKPVLSVQLNNPNISIGPLTVNLPNLTCKWQLISTSFTAATTGPLTIDILLNEAGLGDGNDLALDDISLQEKPQVSPNLLLVNIATTNTVPGQYNVTASYPTLPPGYGYYWDVCELDANDNCKAPTLVSNPSAWWTYPAANKFNGYNGTTNLAPGTTTTSNNPGVFLTSKRYRITFGVWSDCEGWRQTSWLFQSIPGMIQPKVTPLELRRQEQRTAPAMRPQLSPDQAMENGAETLEKPLRLDEKGAVELPRAEDDASSEIAVAKPSVEVGQRAPDFKVELADGRTWRLSDQRNKRNVLLTFFPKCFTGGCANHLSSLRDRQAEFDAAETEIVAVSVDPAGGERGQLAFAQQWQLNFPMVPDTQRRLSKLYGAVRNDKQLAARMSVLIDKQGIVRFVDTNVNVAMHGADMIARIREMAMNQ
jgi:peroxiredoxin